MNILKMPTTFALKSIEGYKNHPSVKTRSKILKNYFSFKKKTRNRKKACQNTATSTKIIKENCDVIKMKTLFS